MDGDGGVRRRCGGEPVGTADNDRRMIDRVMMLRFRPIAPKPVDGDSAAGIDQFGNKSLLFSGIRTKRKYVRVRGRSKNSKSNGHERADSSEKAIVTLQLLPEKADYQRESSEALGGDDRPLHQSVSPSSAAIPSGSPSSRSSPSPDPRAWLMNSMGLQFTDLMASSRLIESWVIVESVATGAGPDALELGRTDEEKVGRLQSLTCPGLVSDLSNRVKWVNGAYMDMVRRGFALAGNEDGRMAEVAVELWVKRESGGLPPWGGAFTCRVRVQDRWREERRSRVVPCDVWRMDCGGFAWRLDVKAALSLGSS